MKNTGIAAGNSSQYTGQACNLVPEGLRYGLILKWQRRLPYQQIRPDRLLTGEMVFNKFLSAHRLSQKETLDGITPKFVEYV